MTRTPRIYDTLPADGRQEFRLPALLKEHLARAAAQAGLSPTQYITRTLADQVTADLVGANHWVLSVDEQVALMKLMMLQPTPSARARKTASRANALFGSLGRRARR